MNWETLGVIVTLLGLGIPALVKLSACVASLAALKERWQECRAEDRQEHEGFRGRLTTHDALLADHEVRITTLESE
jgi:hypothetical protein